MAIDIESDIYSIVDALLTSKFSNIFTTGEELSIPNEPLCASIVEADNYTETATVDSSGQENHSNIMYEISVYSNKTTGKKSEAKFVSSTADAEMYQLGFTRLSRTAMTQNGYYRIIARYVAKVSKNKEIFRR